MRGSSAGHVLQNPSFLRGDFPEREEQGVRIGLAGNPSRPAQNRETMRDLPTSAVRAERLPSSIHAAGRRAARAGSPVIDQACGYPFAMRPDTLTVDPIAAATATPGEGDRPFPRSAFRWIRGSGR